MEPVVSLPVTCGICTEPMVWPTVWPCQNHMTCLDCAWNWVRLQTATDYVPNTCLDSHLQHGEELTEHDLDVHFTLPPVKCPVCNDPCAIDLYTLKGFTVLPWAVTRAFKGSSAWACPFCGEAATTARHVGWCGRRTIKCGKPQCEQQVEVQHARAHGIHDCNGNRCFYCNDGVVYTTHRLLKHLNSQHLQAKASSDEEDSDYEDDSSSDAASSSGDESAAAAEEEEEGEGVKKRRRRS